MCFRVLLHFPILITVIHNSVTIVSRFVKKKVYKNRPVMEIYSKKTDRFYAVGFFFLLNYFRLNTGIESIGASAWIVWPPS